MADKPLVFISCGQFTPSEVALGTEVERLIRDNTSFDAYFAEQQNSLDGLTTNILSNLDRAAGLIAIMHHRGQVDTPDGRVVRGSVWVEQEIAIAAFIQHVLHRRTEVALYLERGIGREGIRQQLRLRPVEFEHADEVLNDVRERIKTWGIEPVSTQPLQAVWQFDRTRPFTAARHDYEFKVQVLNKGSSIVSEWKAEMWFPAQFIEAPDGSDRFTERFDGSPERFFRSYTDCFRYDEAARRIFPEDRLPVFKIPYFVTDQNWPGWYSEDRPKPSVHIRVSAAGQMPWQAEIPIMKIQQF